MRRIVYQAVAPFAVTTEITTAFLFVDQFRERLFIRSSAFDFFKYRHILSQMKIAPIVETTEKPYVTKL